VKSDANRLSLRASGFRRAPLAVAVLVALFGLGRPAFAAHVAAPKLLPRKTLAYVHVPSVPDLVWAFQQTNTGRMIADPQIQPFVQGLFDAADNALSIVKERTGLSLAEIAAIPQGEITLALVPLDDIQGADPVGFIGMVDCGDNIEAARKFADTIHEALKKSGFVGREENVDGITISIYQRGASDNSPFVSLERENTLVVCSNAEAAKQLLGRWTEGHKDSLAQNRKFTTIMDRCRGNRDESPHITFYADPIATLTQVTRDNMAAQIGLRMLPALGLDGLKAVGGSMIMATEDFDGIFHAHLLLGFPKTGVLDLLALDSGDDTPPRWVPNDVSAYTSLHWNFSDMYTRGTKLWDSFQGDGYAAKTLNGRAKQFVGVDLENDLLPAITGRVVDVNWFERPVRLGVGQQSLFGIQLRDPTSFAEVFHKITDHLDKQFERKYYSGIAYYRQGGDRDKDDTRPQPCFMLLDDWVLFSTYPAILEHILSTRDDNSNRLAAALDYKLIAGKIARQPGGGQPSMLTFERPDEAWKWMYDMAVSDQARSALRDRAGSNPFFTALNDGLSKNALPPWEAISKYLAPTGSMIVGDESGIHYMQFAIRRK
jgi:hypothetical protein